MGLLLIIVLLRVFFFKFSSFFKCFIFYKCLQQFFVIFMEKKARLKVVQVLHFFTLRSVSISTYLSSL